LQKSHRSTPSISILASSRISASQPTLRKEDSRPIPAPQQQVSSPWLYTSRDYRTETTTVEKRSNNDEDNDIRFVQRDGNIVPADPNELKETIGRQSSRNDFQQKEKEDVIEGPSVEKTILEERNAHSNEEQRKQVMFPSPLIRDNDSKKEIPTMTSIFQAEQSSVERVSKPTSKSIKIPMENNELQAQ